VRKVQVETPVRPLTALLEVGAGDGGLGRVRAYGGRASTHGGGCRAGEGPGRHAHRSSGRIACTSVCAWASSSAMLGPPSTQTLGPSVGCCGRAADRSCRLLLYGQAAQSHDCRIPPARIADCDYQSRREDRADSTAGAEAPQERGRGNGAGALAWWPFGVGIAHSVLCWVSISSSSRGCPISLTALETELRGTAPGNRRSGPGRIHQPPPDAQRGSDSGRGLGPRPGPGTPGHRCRVGCLRCIGGYQHGCLRCPNARAR
jgi:hypothetical protein